jgi:glyoxylase-like metal-dependent hydrolase (beta-lactamase superfamily II)
MIEKISDTISAVFTDEGFLFSNSMLVNDSISLSIDSGCGKILDSINPESIDILLNSHTHLDHINGNDRFTRARILMHPLEKAALSHPDKITATESWDELMHENTGGKAFQIASINPKLNSAWRVDDTLSEGQIIDCGKTKIEIMHTPGHTSGHLAFFFPNENIVFSGDICLTKVGPWYGDTQTDINDFIDSINRIIKINPEMIITGHITSIIKTGIPEKLIEYRDRILRRENDIYNFIKGNPSTLDEIASRKFIYGYHANNFVLYWEKSMVKKHLNKLIKSGMAFEEDKEMFRA